MNEQQAYRAVSRIFRDVPAECTEVRLSIRVIFHANLYTLTGYLHYGAGTWQRFEAQREQVPVTTELLSYVAKEHGFAMAARPTKRSSTEFLYTFTPQPVDHAYKLESWTSDQLERRQREDRMTGMFAEQLSA